MDEFSVPIFYGSEMFWAIFFTDYFKQTIGMSFKDYQMLGFKMERFHGRFSPGELLHHKIPQSKSFQTNNCIVMARLR